VNTGTDHVAALVRVNDDGACFQLFQPVICRTDFKSAGRQKAMAFGQVGGLQAVGIVAIAGEREGNDLAIEKAGDAAERADP